MSKKRASEYISDKISKLSDEGYGHRQAVAIAYSYARKEGYKVKRPSKSGRPDIHCRDHNHLTEDTRRGKCKLEKWKP